MERGEGREKRRDITRSFPHIRHCEIVRVRRALEKVTDGVAGGVTVGAEVAVRAANMEAEIVHPRAVAGSELAENGPGLTRKERLACVDRRRPRRGRGSERTPPYLQPRAYGCLTASPLPFQPGQSRPAGSRRPSPSTLSAVSVHSSQVIFKRRKLCFLSVENILIL